MAKHTHTGECQICCRRQAVLVRGGRIAKHGYTVDGYFNGTCHGAGHPPFEHSCDATKAAIKGTEDQIAKIRKGIENLRANRKDRGAQAWFFVRSSFRSKFSYWVEIRVDRSGAATFGVEVGDPSKRHNLYVSPGAPVEEIAKDLDEEYCNGLARQIAGLTLWLKDAKARVATWAPKDLTPVTLAGI
jgi:hypothetical protein